MQNSRGIDQWVSQRYIIMYNFGSGPSIQSKELWTFSKFLPQPNLK